MGIREDIRRLVNETPFVDTHEHLWEESSRLKASEKGQWTDIGMLFWHYTDSDLTTAGMSREDLQKVQNPGLTPEEKWKLVSPHYERSKHSGYLQNVRESVRALYGEDDLREDNVASISQQIADGIKPGYYRHILNDVANLEHTQVNSLETSLSLFNETEYPDLLAQDIGFNVLSTAVHLSHMDTLMERSGIDIATLADFYKLQDWVFETCGPRAIALKNQDAYKRRLDFDQVSTEDAAPIFERMMKGEELPEPDMKALQDHLFHRCIDKSVEYNLPVKLHTGYFAGTGRMPLGRVGTNPGDMCNLLQAHPDAKFVFMHITYPYQDELVAICKHYSNAWADLCWAWIVSPYASKEFVKEFILAVPANKLLTFGGDYMPVEMVPGHAVIARRGLAQAVSELVEEGWVGESDAPELIDRLMRGNAHELFDYEGTLASWES